MAGKNGNLIENENDKFIEPRITYFVLRNLILKYVKKHGSLNKLRSEIGDSTNYWIDRGKLEKLAGEKKPERGDEGVNMTLRDLKALNAIFEGEDKLTHMPILTEEVDLLNVFAAERNMDFLVPAFYSKEVSTYVSNRFHIRAFEIIQDNLRHIFIQYKDVVNRKRNNKQPHIEDYKEQHCEWYESINNKSDRVRLCCGNMFLSPAMESILAEKVFSVKPFDGIQRFNANEPDKFLPFYVCYPDEKLDRKSINSSSFHAPPSVALQIAVKEKDKKKAKGNLENKRCMIINGKIYASDRREDIGKIDRHVNYGAFILRLAEPHPDNREATSTAFGCIFGSYAPANLAIAERLFSGKYKNPFIVPSLRNLKTPHVLITIVKTIVGVREVIKDQFKGKVMPDDIEWREVKEIHIEESYLYEYRCDTDIWSIKESLSRANDESMYFCHIEKSDKHITGLKLY